MKIIYSPVSKFFACMTLLAPLAACQPTVGLDENMASANITQAVYQVAPNTVSCDRGGPISEPVLSKCLVVDGKRFYGDIEGYNHKEGVGRALKVERTQTCDPEVFNSCPQDIRVDDIYDYRLLKVIE